MKESCCYRLERVIAHVPSAFLLHMRCSDRQGVHVETEKHSKRQYHTMSSNITIDFSLSEQHSLKRAGQTDAEPLSWL